MGTWGPGLYQNDVSDDIKLSVGSAAVTGEAIVVATVATVHNVVMCKKIVDAIADSKEDKSKNEIAEEGTGVGEAGKEIGDSKTRERPTKRAKLWTGKEIAGNVISERFYDNYN